MALFIGLGVPLLVVFMMAVVGLGLRGEDLGRTAKCPGLIGSALLLQGLLLPLAAVLLISVLSLPVETASALILVAAAPAGGLAIYYTLLAEADIALASAIVAISVLAAALTTPLISWAVFRLVLNQATTLAFPVAAVLRQTTAGLLAPVAAGMLIRWRAPDWTARRIPGLRKASFVALWVILGALLWDQFRTVQAQFGLLFGTASLFTLIMAGAGWACSRLCARATGERRAVLFTFPARNMGVVVLVASSGLGRPDVASLASVFLVVQLATLGGLAKYLARTGRRIQEEIEA